MPSGHVPELLQMRVTARAWNDGDKYGPYCGLLFLHRERAGWDHVGASSL